jgi:hypothetical protein
VAVPVEVGDAAVGEGDEQHAGRLDDRETDDAVVGDLGDGRSAADVIAVAVQADVVHAPVDGHAGH